MRHAIISTLVIGGCLAAAGCYGPDEPVSTLSVTLRYATGKAGTTSAQDQGSRPGAPFEYSLDTYRVAAILDVSGGSLSPQRIPILAPHFSAMPADAGQVQESFDVPSREQISLSVIGFAWDGGPAPVAFATQSPVQVYASNPAMSVDVTPVPLPAGTISCRVTLKALPIIDGTVFIVDQETRIAFPGIAVTAGLTGQGAWYDVAGIPLYRTMEMHYADAAGAWHAGGSFTLTEAYKKIEFAL